MGNDVTLRPSSSTCMAVVAAKPRYTFTTGVLAYKNAVDGTMADYSGKEVILEGGKEIFWTTYQGGLIDRNPGVGF